MILSIKRSPAAQSSQYRQRWAELRRRQDKGPEMESAGKSLARKHGCEYENINQQPKRRSLALAKQIILSECNDAGANSVFSPLSLQLVLALLAAGSEGLTREQLLSFLRFSSVDRVNDLSSVLVNFVLADGSISGSPLLSFASGVWIDQTLSFKANFKDVVDSVYKAISSQVDFQNKPSDVTKEVNAWVEEKTNGLIKDLLPPTAVNQCTRLILANALYFKGTWDEKFDASNTKEYDFHLPNGSTTKAPLMTTTKKQYVKAYNGFKVLRLPYEQGQDNRRFSMYIYLPGDHRHLNDLVGKVCSEPRFLDWHIPYTKVKLAHFLIPKFKVSFGFKASGTVKNLGLILPFHEGLTGMVDGATDGDELFVSGIFHKAFVEVNEEGTEAAAASGIVMEQQCAVLRKMEFVADHPFLFLIREDVFGLVLFIGTVVIPVQV